MLTFSELFLSMCIFVNVPMYPENMYIFCHHHSLKFLWEKLAKMSCFFLCKSVYVFVYAENMYVYFLPPSQSQVSLREVLARKRNLTPTHSLNVCQPVGVEKMANNLYNVWLDIALVKTFLLIVSNWLVASLFPFFSSGNCYSGRSPLLLTSRYECATTIIIIIAIIIIIIYITVTIFFTLHHVTSWSGAQSS